MQAIDEILDLSCLVILKRDCLLFRFFLKIPQLFVIASINYSISGLDSEDFQP